VSRWITKKTPIQVHRHIDIAVWENYVRKKILCINFTVCHIMNKASILKPVTLYVVCEVSYSALMMEAASPWEMHFFWPHGMKSHITIIFTFNNMIALDFIKITLLLSFMIHLDSLLCCMKLPNGRMCLENQLDIYIICKFHAMWEWSMYKYLNLLCMDMCTWVHSLRRR